jgi:hypothetical protein
MNTEKNKAKVQTRDYVLVEEAADLLGVTVPTVQSWISRGRLPSREIEVITKEVGVLRSSLKFAFRVTCKQCGKVFNARRPEKALFCSATHRNDWFKAARQVKKAAAQKVRL